MAGSGIKAKVWGEFLSSKGLLRDNIWMIKATITGRKDYRDCGYDFTKIFWLNNRLFTPALLVGRLSNKYTIIRRKFEEYMDGTIEKEQMFERY